EAVLAVGKIPLCRRITFTTVDDPYPLPDNRLEHVPEENPPRCVWGIFEVVDRKPVVQFLVAAQAEMGGHQAFTCLQRAQHAPAFGGAFTQQAKQQVDIATIKQGSVSLIRTFVLSTFERDQGAHVLVRAA